MTNNSSPETTPPPPPPATENEPEDTPDPYTELWAEIGAIAREGRGR